MFNKPPLFPENTGPQNNFLFTIHKKTNGNTAKELQKHFDTRQQTRSGIQGKKKTNEYQLRYHPLSSSSKFIYIVKIIFFARPETRKKYDSFAIDSLSSSAKRTSWMVSDETETRNISIMHVGKIIKVSFFAYTTHWEANVFTETTDQSFFQNYTFQFFKHGLM